MWYFTLLCYSGLAMEDQTSSQSDPSESSSASLLKGVLLPSFLILGVILAGLGTGWYLTSGRTSGILGGGVASAPGVEVSSGGKVIGLEDSATFRDSAQGKLEEGGINGEGTHHLVRDGGPSQNVYLTSSVIDLDQYMGKTVEVWGETIGAKSAGWLMDVGKIKILD